MMMLITAPVSCVTMARVVRPVDCSSRSKQNWLKIPMDSPRQMVAYSVPYSTMMGSPAAWISKKVRENNTPIRAKTTKLQRDKKMPVLAARSAMV